MSENLSPTPHIPRAAPTPAQLKLVSERTGIARAHLRLIADFCEARNIVVAIRNVETTATHWIESGCHTKNFHIKGKSSNWGPMAGFIPVDQNLSKLQGSSNTAKYSEDVESMLQRNVNDPQGVTDPIAKRSSRISATHLKLSVNDLERLASLGVLTYEWVNKKSVKIQAFSPQGDGSIFQFSGRFSGDKMAIYQLVSRKESDRAAIESDWNERPVRVVCYQMQKGEEIIDYPITADYDLMLIAPSIAEWGDADKPPVRDISKQNPQHTATEGLPPMTNKKGLSEKISRTLEQLAAQRLPRESQDRGNASERTNWVIDQLNERVNRVSNPVFHHNSDHHNPATDINANFPATFILPEVISDLGSSRVLAVTKDNVEHVLQVLRKNEYMVEAHPDWGLKASLRGSYVEAQKAWGNDGPAALKRFRAGGAFVR